MPLPRTTPALLLVLLAGACSRSPEQPAAKPEARTPAQSGVPAGPPVESPVTNRVAAEPEVVSEAPFSPTSAQGAAEVVQTYYALIEARKYEEARRLRWNAADLDPAEFAANFADYADYHATVGKPSEIEGAAGSLYVEVPVQTWGRRKDGRPIASAGTVTLRRVNDVPGSTAEQRRWRIYTSE
jgi:hypothetical protein